MRVPRVESIISRGLVAALAAILAVLAMLQYRWTGQLSQAERERMRSNLDASVNQFRQGFYRELLRVCAAFQVNPLSSRNENWQADYLQRYRDWTRANSVSDMVVRALTLNARENRPPQLMLLNPQRAGLEAVGWPPELQETWQRVEAEYPSLRRKTDVGPLTMAWIFEEQVPALVQPVFGITPGQPEMPKFLGYCIVELDANVLQNALIPELVQAYFGIGKLSPYKVGIVSAGKTGRWIYRSDATLITAARALTDVSTDLLSPRPEDAFRLQSQIESVPTERSRNDVVGAGVRPRNGPPPIVLSRNNGKQWRLIVQHRSGSLDAAVEASRRRNLLLSFGVLLLLTLSMAMVIVSTQRAKRLARLQTDFVAGVSHELRTPLSVICSAAENLADGVVAGREQARQYGTLIRNEARRLSEMVQQTLLFASGRAGGLRYELRPVRVCEVIDRALESAAPMIATAGFGVEKHVDPNLPLVLADATALGQCIGNLISNAVKYGGEARWLRVGSEVNETAAGSEVRVTVEDKGPGISPVDLEHIFEPFYRGRSAGTAQVHGTGLGLTLAKSTAEALGGKLTVASSPGRGSCFTLHVPAVVPRARVVNEMAAPLRPWESGQ